jgi:dynein heavy chain
MLQVCDDIVNVAVGLPRLETKIFPALATEQLTISSCSEADEPALRAKERIDNVVSRNSVGPQSYVKIYDVYNHLLVDKLGKSKSEREVEIFLGKDYPLTKYTTMIEKYHTLSTEILDLRPRVPLNLVALDTSHLQQKLADLSILLANILIGSVVERNRTTNRTTCEQFETIASKLSEKPATTEELTQLDAYLIKVKTETFFKLKEEISHANERLRFLLHFATLSNEDIRLNTTTIKWPEKLEPMFDSTSNHIDETKIRAEQDLKARIENFERALEDYYKEVEAFREKADGLRPEDIMRNNRALEALTNNVQNAKTEVCVC